MSSRKISYRKRLLKVISPALKLIIDKYLSTEKDYTYKDIHLKILPGVFHPGFFFSTKILLNFLQGIDLHNKKLLELGAGSGLISIVASKKGAHVTSTDISITAIRNLIMNSKLNHVVPDIIYSDLFDAIPENEFDYIIINPPFYSRDPLMESEFAWYCGKDFQYFRKLFEQLGRFHRRETKIIMILSEDCNIDLIEQIAKENSINMAQISVIKNWLEMNYLFQLIPVKAINKTN